MKKLFLSLAILLTFTSLHAAERLNVLFIAIDDMRLELSCYGNKIVKSPNIDPIVARGVVFNKAYCQQAVGGPSRTAINKVYRKRFQDDRSWSEPHSYTAGKAVDTDLVDYTKQIVTKHSFSVEEVRSPNPTTDNDAKAGPALKVSLKAETDLPDSAAATEAVNRPRQRSANILAVILVLELI